MPNENLKTESIPLDDLKPHPRNYRGHPDDELDQIVASLAAHGFYRPVVTASDLTILAGHGVVLAAKKMGLTSAPVVRLPLEPFSPAALKLLVGDNEIGHLAEPDDRVLTDLLKELKDADSLLGTGYDEKMLANLLYVTRPAGEIATLDEAAEWAGMPEFGEKEEDLKIAIVFRNKEDRLKWVSWVESCGMKMKMHYKSEAVWSTWWPAKERDDLESVRFEA